MNNVHVSARITLAVAACVALSMGLAGQALGANPTFKILPPGQIAYGKTYGEWGAEWWQWALGIEKARNPVVDPTGALAHVGQSGPVWFLAGTFGGTTSRTCTVPAGKALFFPILNGTWWAPDDIPLAKTIATMLGKDPDSMTVEELIRLTVNWQVDHAAGLKCTIDGVEVQGLGNYRAESPAYDVVLSDLVIDWGYTPGPRGPAVADGYWIMLEPLAVGQHEIHFAGGLTFTEPGYEGWTFSTEMTYHLTVAENPPLVIPPDRSIFGKTYGEWGAEWWKWIYAIPNSTSPTGDPDGRYAALGQAGPVWFLAGNSGGTTERTCTLPSGKAIFFPIVNSVWWAPEDGPTEEALREGCGWVIDHATSLSASIDGAPVLDLASFRADSPGFAFTVPPVDGRSGLTAGRDLAVADGYWVMLSPPPEGSHEIRFAATVTFTSAADGFDFVFALDVTYHLTVAPAAPLYSFRQLAALGDEAPGGGAYAIGFRPYTINNRSDVIFGCDVTTGGKGVFIRKSRGETIEVVRRGQLAPGGGVFGPGGYQGTVPLNDPGDAAFVFSLDPAGMPWGVNAGLYRYSHLTESLSAVVVPGATPAPGGGTFVGTFIGTMLNNRGDLIFTGIVSDADIDPANPPGSGGLGMGLFLQDASGVISSMVRPGAAGPGGAVFDFAENGWINNHGDIAFGAHIQGDECVDFGTPQTTRLFCAESVYVKKASGEIISIAHQGEAAPGGGVYRLAFGPKINDRGEVVFVGDLTPAPGSGQALAVFLYSGGEVMPVARPGDPMPGGGNLKTASFYVIAYYINNMGDVAFSGTLDTGKDTNGDGVIDVNDHGVYVWSRGSLRLVARTGTVVPGVGTIAGITQPNQLGKLHYTIGGPALNDVGQVFFAAALTDGRGVLLLATPEAPMLTLDQQGAGGAAYEVTLSTIEEVRGFSFGLSLNGACGSARIVSVEPGADLPAAMDFFDVNFLDGGSGATVGAIFSYVPPYALIGPGTGLALADVVLAGRVLASEDCDLCFSGDLGDPPVPLSISTEGGWALVPAGDCVPVPEAQALCFRRGDANDDGLYNIADPISILNYLFGGGASLCLDAMDVNDDGTVNIADPIYELEHQFGGGSAPPAPGPFACGADMTADDLGCDIYESSLTP